MDETTAQQISEGFANHKCLSILELCMNGIANEEYFYQMISGVVQCKSLEHVRLRLNLEKDEEKEDVLLLALANSFTAYPNSPLSFLSVSTSLREC